MFSLNRSPRAEIGFLYFLGEIRFLDLGSKTLNKNINRNIYLYIHIYMNSNASKFIYDQNKIGIN